MGRCENDTQPVLLALAFIPGTKLLKPVANVLGDATKYFFKYGDNLLGLVKVNGVVKFTDDAVIKLAEKATKNADDATITKVMLGKWDNGLPSSYVARAGDEYAYFQLDEWDELLDLVDGSDDEIWKINKHFLDEQDNLGKSFYFSHNPNDATGFFKDEIDYLKNSLNVKSFTQVGDNLWKANK